MPEFEDGTQWRNAAWGTLVQKLRAPTKRGFEGAPTKDFFCDLFSSEFHGCGDL